MFKEITYKLKLFSKFKNLNQFKHLPYIRIKVLNNKPRHNLNKNLLRKLSKKEVVIIIDTTPKLNKLKKCILIDLI